MAEQLTGKTIKLSLPFYIMSITDHMSPGNNGQVVLATMWEGALPTLSMVLLDFNQPIGTHKLNQICNICGLRILQPV